MTTKDVARLIPLRAEQSMKLVHRPKLYFVRIGKIDIPFQKGYKQFFTEKVFETLDLPTRNPPTYNLFKKFFLLVTFENAFSQRIGPSCSPDGPMLEVEVLGDRNNFIDLQRTRLEILARIVENNGNVMQIHATKAAQRDTPYLVNNPLSSFFFRMNNVSEWRKNFNN